MSNSIVDQLFSRWAWLGFDRGREERVSVDEAGVVQQVDSFKVIHRAVLESSLDFTDD